MSTEKMTKGVRHNNFLNVKTGATQWRGQTGKDEHGHAIFEDPVYGLRAAIITLRSYWFKHHLRTVERILSRWAPVTDTIGSKPGAASNSPSEYAAFVQKRAGIHPRDALSLFEANGDVRDSFQLYRLVSAMAEYENFAGFTFPKELFDRAAKLI